MIDQPDLKCLENAKNGNLDSFKTLSQRYFPSLVAIAHAKLNDRHLAEDAAQETLFQAWKNLPLLKKLDRFGPWLAAICRNIATDFLRRRCKTKTLEDIQNIPEPTQSQRNDDHFCDAVQAAIGQLPPDAKELIYLKYYDGLSYDQISFVLGLSEQTINGRLRRAKKQLAKTLRKSASIEVAL